MASRRPVSPIIVIYDQLIGKMLALLPEQQRAAIMHTKLDGWSVRETATALQISEAAVKVAVHRGLKTLASKMRDEP